MLINGHAICGIDPGLSGALAICRDRTWSLLDMPIVGDSKHHEVNAPEVLRWLREHAPEHVYLEFASARPGQGVSGMFRYGACYGAMKMACAALNLPVTLVTPQKWKKAVGIVAGADKEASRQRALQLFPELTVYLARKKDHARSDALLLAHYGILKLQAGI